MEVVEIVPGVTFPDAHELPNSTVQPASKHVSIKSSGNGTKKPRNPLTPLVTGKLKTELAKIDQEITAANKMVMVVSPEGKRRFVKLSEYRVA